MNNDPLFKKAYSLAVAEFLHADSVEAIVHKVSTDLGHPEWIENKNHWIWAIPYEIEENYENSLSAVEKQGDNYKPESKPNLRAMTSAYEEKELYDSAYKIVLDSWEDPNMGDFHDMVELACSKLNHPEWLKSSDHWIWNVPFAVEQDLKNKSSNEVEECLDIHIKIDHDNNEEERLVGGIADGKNPSDFDLDSLEQGIEVEMEHTDDESTAMEIAMDHLTEDPDYYIKLATIHQD